MPTQFVQVVCDVSCTWSGTPPRYRAYVNDELFTERTWIWTHTYLEELFQIKAPVGKYTIKYELVDTESATLKVKNLRMHPSQDGQAVHGTVSKHTLEILP
jgi:hypothetical protein